MNNLEAKIRKYADSLKEDAEEVATNWKERPEGLHVSSVMRDVRRDLLEILEER